MEDEGKMSVYINGKTPEEKHLQKQNKILEAANKNSKWVLICTVMLVILTVVLVAIEFFKPKP